MTRMTTAVSSRADFLALPQLPPRLKLWGEDRELEDFLTQKAFAIKPLPQAIPRADGTVKIAVVGSGPAGLGSADELTRLGFKVTVFERADRPGGLLMYGVPNIKLPKELVLQQVQALVAQGVEFRLQTEIGKDVTFAELQKEFAAIIVCVGSTEPRRLPMLSTDAHGVYYAKDFLTAATKALLDGHADAAAAAGKDVVIVGGGDTGIDCAALALAQGARSIYQIELQTCEMTGKTQAGFCELIADDPTLAYATLLQEIFYDERGFVKGVRVADVAWVSQAPGSLPKPQVIEGTARELPAQLLLLATGFSGPEAAVFSTFAFKKTPVGTIAKGSGYFDTSRPGVFAAGDARRGQGVVEWAFAEGRNAAAECAQYLHSLQKLPALSAAKRKLHMT